MDKAGDPKWPERIYELRHEDLAAALAGLDPGASRERIEHEAKAIIGAFEGLKVLAGQSAYVFIGIIAVPLNLDDSEFDVFCSSDGYDHKAAACAAGTILANVADADPEAGLAATASAIENVARATPDRDAFVSRLIEMLEPGSKT